MRVLIYTFGTQGDIQPYVALATALQHAGHEAAVCTAEGYRGLVEGHGVGYLHMDNTMLELIRDAMPTMRGARDTPKIIRAMNDAQRAGLDDQWAAAETYAPTIVVYHPKALGGYHIAEKLGVPGVLSLPLPFFTPTTEFGIPFIGRWPLSGRANRLTYQLQRATALLYGSMINDFRRRLALPPIRRTDLLLHDRQGRPVPVLYPFSRHVRPVPADYPPHVHVTGYWFLDHAADWQPSPTLLDFLAAGPPPLYVGFGSMGFGRDTEQPWDAILTAVGDTGGRALLASGWSAVPAESRDDLLVVEQVPHDWLLPRVGAVVHHGGSGTTGAGLRAGRPTLICPFLGDQPFWGHQIHRIGVGPEPLPWRRLTAERLRPRLHQLLSDQTMQDAARRLGQQVRAEDGPARAVSILEDLE